VVLGGFLYFIIFVMNFTTFFISYLRLKKEGHYVEELYVRRISFFPLCLSLFYFSYFFKRGKIIVGEV